MERSLSLGVIIVFLVAMGCKKESTAPLFQQLDHSYTGIDFSNDLSNSDSLIALSFEYLYNGSGVAVGDFNNDGLPDLFFSGSMVPSRLYLNEGNLQFKDITATAGVNTQDKWSSGVALVDINEDGWLDIYVCVGGLSSDPKVRSNLLFINQKDNTFTESAQAYGLDDSGYSINAAFFDYDRDGDLDLYVLTTELDPYSWTEFRPRRLNGEGPNTDRLYRNNGDQTFTDVSREAGILIEGYGLGIGICDLNQDGWSDIYVANDFLSNDVIYINNGDGTFSDKIDDYLTHTSRNGMGVDLQDFNNDGLTDIMVLDMLPKSNQRQKSMFGFFNYDKFKLGLEKGYQPQYPRNTLQRNNGDGTFSEVGQLAGIDQTDWSWCTLFADFDNDGWQDIFITNGYRQDITNMDFATFSRQLTSSPIGTEKAKETKMFEKLRQLPEIKAHNYLYRNTGQLPFEDKSEAWGFGKLGYSNGAAYADLDQDGDLDLVVSNLDEKASIYKNNLNDIHPSNFIRIALNGPVANPQGLGAKVIVQTTQGQQYRFVSPYRGYLSTVESTLHFGLDSLTSVNSIKVTWPDGKIQLLQNIPANQTLTLAYNNAKALAESKVPKQAPLFQSTLATKSIKYRHRENDFVDFKIQPILPHKHSQNGPGLAVGDINGDQLEDFFIGGSAGYPGQFFVQTVESTFIPLSHSIDSIYEDMGTLLFDADNDNDLDLYIVSGGSSFQENTKMYQDRLYLNDGFGHFSRAASALPPMVASGASVSAADYDQDGDLDLFVCGRVLPGAYPQVAQSYLLRNDTKQKGQCVFTDVSAAQLPEHGLMGMVSAALWTDFNEDNAPDLLLAGEWMPLTFLKNEGGEKFTDVSTKTGLEHTQGWWNSLVAGDFDSDGDMDYAAGNLGWNTRYDASPEEPVCIYAKDYDNNGRIDPVLCHYIEGKNYIAHSRDMLIKQINSMRVRFKTYAEYGAAPFERSFTKDELSDAYVVKSETFASSYIENQGNGKFVMKNLPTEAQIAPIYGMQTGDYNGDGHLDLLLVGNSYATEIMIGQYDACRGVFLAGDGQGNFQNIPLRESGFLVDQDAKALSRLTINHQASMILATRNNGTIKAYQNTTQGKAKWIATKPNETYALIKRKDGGTQRVELFYGSTYLSQSSRSLALPSDAEEVLIFNASGKSRKVK